MADNKEDLEEILKHIAIQVCEARGIDPFQKIEVEQWEVIGEEIIEFLGTKPLITPPQKLDS